MAAGSSALIPSILPPGCQCSRCVSTRSPASLILFWRCACSAPSSVSRRCWPSGCSCAPPLARPAPIWRRCCWQSIRCSSYLASSPIKRVSFSRWLVWPSGSPVAPASEKPPGTAALHSPVALASLPAGVEPGGLVALASLPAGVGLGGSGSRWSLAWRRSPAMRAGCWPGCSGDSSSGGASGPSRSPGALPPAARWPSAGRPCSGSPSIATSARLASRRSRPPSAPPICWRLSPPSGRICA